MTNHPNRRRTAAANPTPEQICAARKSAGLTQAEASALIFCAPRTWQQWEGGERQMHPAFWTLFQIHLAARRNN